MIGLIFPHQLFDESPLLDLDLEKIILVEEFLFFHQYPFHKQKIAFHRASMKLYAESLANRGYNVEYYDAQNKTQSDIRYIITTLKNTGVKELAIIDPTDFWLEQRIRKQCHEENITLSILENPLFLNSKEYNSTFFNAKKKKYYHSKFYQSQRIKYNLLVDTENKPIGGKWSFDDENRKKYPRGVLPPKTIFMKSDLYVKEAYEYVEQFFPENYGTTEQDLFYPINSHDAKIWLQQFLQERFLEFGKYEDAILSDELILNHSLLSPLLNVGLITPQYVISHLLEFAKDNKVPINSTEGIIRQIIGWREFIRGIYEANGVHQRTSNHFGFKNTIPKAFYDGTTGIPPIDQTIKKVLKYGYCHHIERLMVLGNFMLLCEFKPNAVYQWFMELFIDAYDWVMVPNVYGMSQFSDGGLLASKPYISSSNYILKMSNYKKGEWQLIWDGLFWRFMNQQRTSIGNNPRLKMLLKTYDKMDDDKKTILIKSAEDFLKKIHS